MPAIACVVTRAMLFSGCCKVRSELLQQVKETISAIDKSLDLINEEQLNDDYPLEVFGHKMTTGYFLIHLSGHLAYHLGQVNYHRRLLDA
jgi:hypothetical protein